MARDSIGGLEELVLIAVQALGREAYGFTIKKQVAISGRHVSVGALYVTLDRLEDKGFLESRIGDPTPERGGRAKKFFTLTGAGAYALHESEEARRLVRGQQFEGGVA